MFKVNVTVAVMPVVITILFNCFMFGVRVLSLVKAVTKKVADAPKLTTTSSVDSDSTPDVTCTAICPVTVIFLVLFVRFVTTLIMWKL